MAYPPTRSRGGSSSTGAGAGATSSSTGAGAASSTSSSTGVDEASSASSMTRREASLIESVVRSSVSQLTTTPTAPSSTTEAGDLDENRPSWRTVCLGLPKADEVGEWVKSMIIGAVAPFIPIWKVLSQVEGSTGAEAILSKEKMVLLYTALSAVCIYFASILLIFSTWEANLRMLAASLYLAFACVVSYTRYMTRTGLGIQFGDALTDVCLSVLFYPLVLAQCERECALGTIGGAPPQAKIKVSEA